MDADRALAWIETVVFEEMGVQFNQIIRQIFTLAWEGGTYEAIARQVGYEESYVRDLGSQLFRTLRQIFGKSINKKNFRGILERQYKNQTTIVQAAEELPSSVMPATATGYPARTKNFLGRKADLEALQQQLQEQPIVLIHGPGGSGKTTLARKYLELYKYRPLAIWMPAESPQLVTPVEMIVEEWLRGEFGLDPGCDFGINLDRLRRCFEQSPQPIGILLDNLESALDHQGHFIQAHRGYLDLLRLLSDRQLNNVITLITSRHQLKESRITPARYPLQGLAKPSWIKYFRHHGISVSPQSLEEMWRACLGNPKAMEILKGTAIVEFDGDLEAYWQSCDRNLLTNGSVQDLVESQINAIAQADPDAYRLLCRLGVYRYQQVPAVSLAGVKAMLWDIPEAEQPRLMQSLRSRSLLEARRNQKFWLHPLLHKAVRQRLQNTTDWETSQRQAGEFWLAEIASIDTVEQAQQVLEAYHHYLEIAAYDDACNVLITPKPNRWNHTIEVGWLFYRFSLLQQITRAITRIIDHIPHDQRAARLYNLLGYVTRLCGNPRTAIAHHQQALEITHRLRQQDPPSLVTKQLEASTRFNLGLCYRDLWELDMAAAQFQHVKQITSAAGVDDYTTYANCCLAFIYSSQNDREQTLACLNQIPTLSLQAALTSWGKACSLLYLASTYHNLGDMEAATEIYQDTLLFAQDQQFTHIVANAYHGLAQVNRLRQRYDEAMHQHDLAIDRLQQITAKCDLADAYLERGITARELGKINASQTDFAHAIELIQVIQAPERLKRLHQLTMADID